MAAQSEVQKSTNQKMKKMKLFSAFTLALCAFLAGCDHYEPMPVDVRQNNLSSDVKNKRSGVARLATLGLGSAESFSVLAATTVTNDGLSLISTDLGVSPGTAITGFQPAPLNTIMGPGTVTAGSGIVTGTIYAGGPVAQAAQADAAIAYNSLISMVPDFVYEGVTQLNGMTFTPGVYNFAPSANLEVNGTLYLDFQGNSEALFVFQMGTTLVTMAGSNIVAINNNEQDCIGANVYWAIGSSATIDGAKFIGNVIATTTITMTSGSNVSGRLWALNGAVTMITNTITACGGTAGEEPVPPKACDDFVTGGGSVSGSTNEKSTFGVSAGIRNEKLWGNFSFNNHRKNGVKVKSTSVTAYTILNALTRQIEGVANVNGKGSFTYKVIVTDNGEPGRQDIFSLELSNGYSASGVLEGGNIQLHQKCVD